MVIYPNLNALREIYSEYINMHLGKGKQKQKGKELVLLLPYYETPDTIRHNLGGNNKNDSDNKIHVRNYEKEGSLVIIDSVKAYFGFQIDIISFIRTRSKHLASNGKKSVSVIADMGSFYHFGKIEELMKYETSLPTKYSTSKYDNIKLKAFCCYHDRDFDRLKEEQKQKLVEHHSKNLMIIDNA
jgi:hypothetical protein